MRISELQRVRQTFVTLAGILLSTVHEADKWGMGASSVTLESLLHLAVGELSTACQQETARHSRAAPEQQAPQARLPQVEASEVTYDRALCAAVVIAALTPLAEQAASKGHLSLQRLVDCAPSLIQVRLHHFK